MAKIQPISLERMNNGAHFQFVSLIREGAEADETVKEKAASKLNAFAAAVENEDECMIITRKSFATDHIVVWDGACCSVYGIYKRAVMGYLDYPVKEIADSAKVLNQHLIDYAIETQMQLDRKTALFTNLIHDLTTTYTEQVEALSFTSFVTHMQEANENVKKYMKERLLERKEKESGAMKAAKTKTSNAYRDFVEYINALSVISTEGEYDDFVSYANTVIKHYKQEVLGVNPSTDEDPDGDEPEDDRPVIPDEGETDEPEGPEEETDEEDKGDEEEEDRPPIE